MSVTSVLKSYEQDPVFNLQAVPQGKKIKGGDIGNWSKIHCQDLLRSWL